MVIFHFLFPSLQTGRRRAIFRERILGDVSVRKLAGPETQKCHLPYSKSSAPACWSRARGSGVQVGFFWVVCVCVWLGRVREES